MGKKKGYNVAEMDSKQEDKKIEIKESFTVQDYDAIANDVKNDEPCKEPNDPDQDETQDDDSSCDSHQSDTQETNAIEPVSYKDDSIDVNNQSTKDDTKSNLDAEESAKQQSATESSNSKSAEENTSKTNATESVPNKGDGVDSDQSKEDADSNPSTKAEGDTKSDLDDGASKKQQCGTESSNLKASEQYTSIDLGEVKHAPKNSLKRNCLKQNRYCIIIVLAAVVGMIAIISIAASRKRPTTSGDKDELMPRKAEFPPGFQPATDEIEQDYNITTTGIASSQFESKTNEITTHGTNSDTTASVSTHQTEMQHTTTPPITTKKNTDEDDDDYGDYPADNKNVPEDADSGSGEASLPLNIV